VILAAGVLVASLAPWKHPPAPVLRPTGLIAGSAGASEVALRWSSPATGPSPDRYEILRNGHRVGYAAGSVTSYRDTMLAPASSYSYQLIAIRDGKLSPPSAALAVDTVKPPVSDAVLDGKWDVNLSVTSTTHFNWGSDPKKWADKWAIQRACTDGPCNVTAAGKFSQVTFSDSLTRDGAVYAGTVPMNNFAYCTSSKKYMPGSLSIQITVDSAAVIGTAWTASSFRGTLTFTDTAGATGCNVGKVIVSVAGTG
jgi:hypothetical protein